MKLFVQGAVLLLGMGFLSAPAKAQKVVIEGDAPNSIVLVNQDKAGGEVVRMTNETQNPRFHDPKTPRFVLTDRKGRFALGIGSYVGATAGYDFDGISSDIDFYPSMIPNGRQNYVRNQFQVDAATSTIFLKLAGRTKHLGDFVVYTAGSFRGDNKTFELQNTYVSLLGFTMGCGYSTFMDLAALPPSISYTGPTGRVFSHTTLLRYERAFDRGWKAGVGIEMPVVDGITNQSVNISNQRIPNFPAYIQYAWNKSSHIRVTGIVRNMTYENLVAQQAESEADWGVFAASTFNVTNELSFYGQATYDRGVSQFLNDTSNLDVDLVPDPEARGRMQVLPMMSWYAGLQYNITPEVFVSSTYSQTRLYSENDYPVTPSDQYHYGQCLVTSIFWNVNANLRVGAEYLRDWHTDSNDMTRHANRLNVSAQYNF